MCQIFLNVLTDQKIYLKILTFSFDNSKKSKWCKTIKENLQSNSNLHYLKPEKSFLVVSFALGKMQKFFATFLFTLILCFYGGYLKDFFKSRYQNSKSLFFLEKF